MNVIEYVIEYEICNWIMYMYWICIEYVIEYVIEYETNKQKDQKKNHEWGKLIIWSFVQKWTVYNTVIVGGIGHLA